MVSSRESRKKIRQDAASSRVNYISALIGDSKRACAMASVESFRSVPTIFSSFNRASTVCGAPLSCVWLIHGPSGGGKTGFAIGLIISFQKIGAITALVDAELAADTKRWLPRLGVDLDRCLYIGRKRSPDSDVPHLTYEEVVEEVDSLIERFRSARREGSIPVGTPLIIVIDSISKLVPRSLFKSLDKDGGDALRGGVGRTQALLNTAWLSEIGLKVGDDDILFCVIAHEMEKESKTSWVSDFKVRGGASLVYDAMMQVRITYAGGVRDLSAEGSPIVGKRHRVKILKNKHGPAYKEAVFYTSNGEGVAPIGFDRLREVLHEGLLRGIVKGPKPDGLTIGSRLEWGSNKFTLKQAYQMPDIAIELAKELDSGLIDSVDHRPVREVEHALD